MLPRYGIWVLCVAIAVALPLGSAKAQSPSFLNFETAPVHPVELGPDGRTLAVCNLPDRRVELFDVSSGVPQSIGDVPVGIDPVSLRFRTTNELWVANFISRSVSVVDVAGRRVVDIISTLDGPADIQFAGSPPLAFVSCAKENTVQVFDPLTRQVTTNLLIEGERPKAMALSPDGSKLYVAIFESGNGSTILVGTQPDTANVLRHPAGPYGGQFPVPNAGTSLSPPLNAGALGFESLLPDSLIVKKDAAGRWMDDNQGDWTEFISGTNAALSGRIPGWDLPDRDLAIIDTTTLTIGYVTGLMNLCFDAAVNPASGRIAIVGTDGTNERRFEPNLRGTFLRVNLAMVEPDTLAATILDLNPHLDYSAANVAQSVRALSIGDPRGIAWNTSGTRGYITGMGSRNLVVIDAEGRRVGTPIELGEGPSGLEFDEARHRLYVLNRFSATLSVLDTITLNLLTNVPFFDPTPVSIKAGRKHLYDTHRNSGLGQASCASCHPDARFDRLAWDLGDPRMDITSFPGDGRPFHPMKGPMVTLTLQDIIVPDELVPIMPLHWRGDRPTIENFNVTFTDLLARDSQLTTHEMEELKDFLATIHFAPSRFRAFDNSTPTNLPLPGFFGVDSNGVPNRTPLPNGNAQTGAELFVFNEAFDGRFELTGGDCRTCHNRLSGRGAEGDFTVVAREGNRIFRTAQLRSLTEKLGMDLHSTNSRAGFGLRFDGRSATLTDVFADVFREKDNQIIADVTAFLVSIPGRGFGTQTYNDDSQDTHAAVGRQFLIHNSTNHSLPPEIFDWTRTDEPPLDVIAHGFKNSLKRSWHYDRDTTFQSDRHQEKATLSELLALAGPETPLVLTILPLGTGRPAIDRDGDGSFDRTELDTDFDPADPLSHPPLPPVLTIVHEATSNYVTLRWPNTGVFRVFATTTPAVAASWQPVSGLPVLAGEEWSQTLAFQTGSHFFRLEFP